MTNTFSVGDKIRHEDYSTGEITYGPLSSTRGGRAKYLMKDAAGNESIASAQFLTAVSKFAIGDKVAGMYSGKTYEIEAGPFKGVDGAWYATKDETTGVVGKNNERVLTAVTSIDEPVKVGDRIRVLMDRANNADVNAGDVFTVASLEGIPGAGVRTTALPSRSVGWYFSLTNVEKVTGDVNTHTYNGVTYDLNARYRDQDSDVWTLKDINGTVRGDTGSFPRVDRSSVDLAEIVRRWGPLTKI